MLTLQVLDHARGRDGLGEDDGAALDVPRDDRLRRRDPELLRDLRYLSSNISVSMPRSII